MMLPFNGHSPILPFVINYALLVLYQESFNLPPDLPDDERMSIDMGRSVTLFTLHQHFEAQTHEQAVEIIKGAWGRHSRFGLYLRNFSLGAQNTTLPDGEEAEGAGGGDVVSMISMVDVRLQNAIVKHISPELPFVGIENPSYDPRHDGTLPKLSLLDDAWPKVVRQLIAAAEVILLCYDRPSPGVSAELGLIRKLGRQQATVVIQPAGEAASSQNLMTSLRRQAQTYGAFIEDPREAMAAGAPPAPPNLGDFTNVVLWDERAGSLRRLKKAVCEITPQHGRVRFTKRAPAPAAPRPPSELELLADSIIQDGLTLAGEKFRRGNPVLAEDILTTCLAWSFWGDIAEARAVLFLSLAAIQLRQEKVRYAAENIRRALDIVERLRSPDLPTLLETFKDVAAGIKRYGDNSVARKILKRVKELQAAADVPRGKKKNRNTRTRRIR